MSGYGRLATEVYDVAYPVGHSMNGDVEHYRDLLTEVGGRVLEPAVGTGRVLMPLLEAGLDVTGYDLSPAMVARCRQHARAAGFDPQLTEGDMSTYREPGAYAAVVVPAGSIVLLDGLAPTRAALARFHECLEPGGLLALDVPAPSLVGQSGGLRTWQRGATTWTVQTLATGFDAVANQRTSWLRHDRWDDGALVDSELLRFRLQHWSLREVEGLLADAGFVALTVVGGYAGPPGPEDDVWTFHARRR